MSDWRHEAACLEADPELFWPIGNPSRPGPAQLQADKAKAWCARCDVILACREWALSTGQAEGVWGGLTGAELASARRKRARVRRAVRS